MCLIIGVPKGVKKDTTFLYKAIANGWSGNDHAAGFALKYKGDNRVYINKDSWNKRGIKAFIDEIKKQNLTEDDELLLHFRIGTSGSNNNTNAHPFVVDSKAAINIEEGYVTKPVLVHNGIFSEYSDHASVYSDTYMFTKKFMAIPEMLSLIKRDPTTFAHLFKKIFWSNKIGLLFPDKDMTLIGDFVEENGVYFSNQGYRNTYYRNIGGFEEFEDLEKGADNIVSTATEVVEEEVKAGYSELHPSEASAFHDCPFLPEIGDGLLDNIPKKNHKEISVDDNSNDKEDTLTKLASRENKYPVTTLNFKDMWFLCQSSTSNLDKGRLYTIETKVENTKLMDDDYITLKRTWVSGHSFVIARVDLLKANCDIYIEKSKKAKYDTYHKLLSKLGNTPSKSALKKIKKKMDNAYYKKKEKFTVKSLGELSYDGAMAYYCHATVQTIVKQANDKAVILHSKKEMATKAMD